MLSLHTFRYFQIKWIKYTIHTLSSFGIHIYTKSFEAKGFKKVCTVMNMQRIHWMKLLYHWHMYEQKSTQLNEMSDFSAQYDSNKIVETSVFVRGPTPKTRAHFWIFVQRTTDFGLWIAFKSHTKIILCVNCLYFSVCVWIWNHWMCVASCAHNHRHLHTEHIQYAFSEIHIVFMFIIGVAFPTIFDCFYALITYYIWQCFW